MTLTQQIMTVACGILATMLTRFVPFLVFRPGKPTPRSISYLGKLLPASVFALLVVYCLRSASSSPDALAQIAGVIATLALHGWRRNLMWSIAAGTACYMVLIRI